MLSELRVRATTFDNETFDWIGGEVVKVTKDGKLKGLRLRGNHRQVVALKKKLEEVLEQMIDMVEHENKGDLL